MRADNIPPAYWDTVAQSVRDVDSHVELPNYAGLCLFTWRGHSQIMNTFLDNGERVWQIVATGALVPREI